MNRTTIFSTPALLAALICIAAPAGAASRGGQSRDGAIVGRAAPRASAPRVAPPRSIGSPRIVGMVPRAVGPRTFGPRGYLFAPGVLVGRVGPRIVGRVGVVSPYRFARPFYTFRPRVSLGFGLWAGFPVAYPYYVYGYPSAYPYPYPYPYRYSYPYPYSYSYSYPYPYPTPAYGYPSSGYPPANYPTPGSVGVQPGQSESGGVSLEITPNTAAVYVDGQYVGSVANFAPTLQPLTLTPGRHHLEVRSAGYQTLSFDADVTPGQVIPFQGTMQPIRPY
jgi:hypothetical protein